MNHPPFRTANLLCRDDRALALAFLGIEEQVILTRASVIAAEMLFADAWACGPQVLGDVRKASLGLSSEDHLLVLTDDHFQAVEHLIRRARNDANALRDAYYAGFGLEAQFSL